MSFNLLFVPLDCPFQWKRTDAMEEKKAKKNTGKIEKIRKKEGEEKDAL